MTPWLAAQADHRPLLPRPQEISYGSSYLRLGGITVSFTLPPTAQDRFAAQQLAAGLSAMIHNRVPVVDAGSSAVSVLLDRAGDGPDIPSGDEKPGPQSREAYRITITRNGAVIRAGSSTGLFYGAQTLLQMVEGEGSHAVLPVAEVHDWPALAYRGFMMDFSEGQRLRVPEIERQLDLLARFKGNQYYFYSEMSIAWDGFEAVNVDPDSKFTKDEVRHIIEFARQRHIDVVPCLELYGHMHALFRVEKFADLGLPRYGDEFDPRNADALKAIDNLLDQATALFGSAWINVGFDEPWSLGKIGVTPGTDPFQTFAGYLQHVADRAQSRGKRIIYWADVENPSSTLRAHPELIDRLPTNAIAGPWQYDVLTNYDPFIKPLADAGHSTLVTPAIYNWNEIFPDYHHTFANINGMVAAGKKFKTLGVINTGWTDCGQTLYRQSLPGIAFGAVAAWQAGPVETNSFLADYAALSYPAAAAAEVAAALKDLSEAEALFENILQNTTQHGFWKDPLEPSLLARLEQQQEPCRKARLLAEEAEEHIVHAMRAAPGEPTLKSLMVAARLFDYLGMKCLYPVEWAGYFRTLQANPDEKLITLFIGVQMVQQGNGMLADLTDAITGLREPYREAWLEESTPYRLDAALVRWDAEARFWQDTWGRVNELLRTRKKGEPFPSIDAIRVKH